MQINQSFNIKQLNQIRKFADDVREGGGRERGRTGRRRGAGAVDTRGKFDTPPYTIYGSTLPSLDFSLGPATCRRFSQMSPGSDFIYDSGNCGISGKCSPIYFLSL